MQQIDIQDIFRTQLKIESKVMQLETLFANERRASKTDYKPSYQRNYVWDTDKATYFIESILLGTEIPPIILFNSINKIEVIDGRQRYETIKRFLEGEFKLKRKGLLKLKDLSNKSFQDLKELKDTFWDTKLRVIEFSFLDQSLASSEKEDLVKKEIFRRYNSGITPLRAVEIDKAKYEENQVNAYFKNRITNSETYRKILAEIFGFEQPFDIEKVLRKIRQQIALPYIPIRYYSGTNKQEVIDRFFEYLSEDAEDDIEKIYINFSKKLEVLRKIKIILQNNHIITNRIIFECLFWGLSIIEKENKLINILLEKKSQKILLSGLNTYIDSYKIEDSNLYTQTIERYQNTAKIFQDIYNVNLDLYVMNNPEFKQQNNQLSQVITDNDALSRFESLRLNKPEPSSITIDDITSRMNKERFLIRPPYQRKEVIDRRKSSGIIESILLGIKIPPIFLFKREDGIAEVIDGQQRLLSILGYLGKSFINEEKRSAVSEKNNFALSRNLKILKDVEGKKFSELPTHYQERILDFDLWIIEINEKINKSFDPIDLFIRLNYKPFPILENTFEMWNSFVNRELIETIKNVYNKYKKWFFVRVDNRRMENESLVTYLSFLEFHTEEKDNKKIAPNNLDFYRSSAKLNVRITNKNEITQDLDNTNHKQQLISSCNQLEKTFIQKLKILISDNGDSDENLKINLDNLLGTPKKRRFQNFYALWYILLNISEAAILDNKVSLKNEINGILKSMTVKQGVDSFYKEVRNLEAKYH